MPRKKKSKNETPEEIAINKAFKHITDKSTRSEKIAWKRKFQKMQGFIDKLSPIENQILELHAQKMDIIDEVQILRGIMVKECIHPDDYLVYHDNHIECKFCNKRLSISSGKKKDNN